MALQTSGPISISNIAAEFNCAKNLTACAVAAGLPTTNIKMTSFYGLSSYTPPVINNPLTPTPYGYYVGYKYALVYFRVYGSGTWKVEDDGLSYEPGTQTTGTWLSSGDVSNIQIKITPTDGTFTTNGAATWTNITTSSVISASLQDDSGEVFFTVEFRDKNTLQILSTTTGCHITAVGD